MVKWSRGDSIILSDHRSIHRGKTGTLVARWIGKIAGRPYWTIRLDHNGAITSEFEDSLEAAHDRGLIDIHHLPPEAP